MRTKDFLLSTLPAPGLPSNLPEHAQWLAGEGAGSWFVFDFQSSGLVQVARYGPRGELECIGIFGVRQPGDFDLSRQFKVTYLSHCRQVTLVQDGVLTVLDRVG